jgi:transposase
MITLGVDIHKKYSQVAILNEQGELQANIKMPNEKQLFSDMLSEFKEPCQAVIESSYSWGTMYDLLTNLGVDVTVAHSLKVKAIASAKIKTDKIDAKTLAELLRANLIPEVHVPCKDVRSQKDLLRQRCWLIKIRTMLKNRVYLVISRNHVESSCFSDLFGVTGRKFLRSLELPNPDNDILRQDLEVYDFIDAQIKQTNKWIEVSLKENHNREILKTLPGFGPILSALAALEIDTIERFDNPSKLSSYSGLVPTTYASGGRVFHGKLTPYCNHWLRYAFVEAAWSAIKCSPYCRLLYARVKKHKNHSAAITVIARRLAEIAYYCLKENRNYEERPYRYIKQVA